jgi:signal transduction histidine kinase
MQEKSRQLPEASQHKSQFLANMSQELRTTLSSFSTISTVTHRRRCAVTWNVLRGVPSRGCRNLAKKKT